MRKIKLFLSLLMLIAFSVGNVWGADATITFANKGLENGVQYTDPLTFDDSNITVTFAGGGNDGKYYDTGSGIRTYGGGSFTVATASGTITAATFTWDGNNKPSNNVANPGTYNSSTMTWTGDAASFTMSRPSGSGHWRLQSISVTYTATPSNYDITLIRNGASETINEVASGTDIDDIDGNGAQGGCSAWEFIGWSKTQRAAQNSTEEMPLVTKVDGVGPYYAVYRHTESGGGSGSQTFTFSSIASANSWENSEAYTTVTLGDVTVKAEGGGNNGKWYTSGNGSWRMYSGGTVKITSSTGDITAVSSSPSCTFTISDGEASFSPTARTDFTEITVSYSGGSTTYYSTTASCCEALSDIDGSVSASTATSVNLEWDKIANVDGTTPYEVEVSPNAGVTVGSIDLSGSKATCAITGMTPCTDYTITIKANGATGYCDASQAINHTTIGYSYTKSLTDVTLKSGGVTSTCDGDYEAVFQASTGYALPENIIVSNAGEEGTDWFWDNSDGSLLINKASVTGNVEITIMGVLSAVAEINVSKSEINFDDVKKGVAASTTFTVSGANLSDANITLSYEAVEGDNIFTFSKEALTPSEYAGEGTEITLFANTATAGDFAGTITVKSGTTSKTIDVYLTVLQTYTVNWYVNGTKIDANSITDVVGTAVTAPSDFSAFTDCQDLTFVGWKEGSAIDGGSTTEAPSLAEVVTTIPAANKDYYAVFAEGTPGSAQWEKATSVAAGEYLIVYETGGVAFDGSLSTLDDVGNTIAVTINDSKIAYSNATEAAKFTIAAKTGGYSIKSASNLYIGQTSNANGLATSETDDFVNTISISEGNADIVCSSAHLRYNSASNQTRFRYYKSTSYSGQNAIQLYKKNVSPANFTKWYTTCPHCNSVTLSKAGESAGNTFALQRNSADVTSVNTCEAVTVDVVASPATGYELTNIVVSGVDGASVNTEFTQISIPQNAEGTLTVTATFSQKNYSVTLNHTEGVDPVMTGATDEAHYGGTINLTTTIPSNAIFVNWTSSDVTITNATSATEASFTMPAKDVTVTANFTVVHNVAWAIANTPSSGTLAGVYVKGIVKVNPSVSTQYHNADYYICDLDANGEPANEFYVYRGKNVGNTNFTNANQLTEGDEVVIYGTLKNHQGKKEFDQGNYIVANGRTAAAVSSVVVSGTADKTAYYLNEIFEHAGLSARAIYNTGYQKDVTATAAWTNDLTGGKVTENTTVHVTATYSEIPSDPYDVAVTVTTKTLESIELSETALTGYKGVALPKPTTVTAHFDDNGTPSTSNVTALAVYDEAGNYDANSTSEQTIEVKYTFGLNERKANYTVTLSSIVNTIGTAYSVEKAQEIIEIDKADGNNLDLANADNKVYVIGRVKSVNALTGTYTGKYTIVLEDQTDNTKTIELYRNTLGTGITSVEVGDLVKAYGNLYWFVSGSKYEINEGGQVVWKQPKVDIQIANKTLEIGDVWTIDADIDPEEAPVTYSIKVGSDACITLDGDEITATAEGTATIIAHADDYKEYLGNEKEFIVTVKPAAVHTSVVILAEYNGLYYALNNAAGTTEVQMRGGKVVVADEVTMNAIVWDRAESGGVATFYNADANKYLNGSNSTTLSVVASEGDYTSWTWVENATKAYYTSDPNASRTFLYQSGQGIKNYAASNIGNSSYAQPIMYTGEIVVGEITTLRGNLFDGKWGTYCPAQSVMVPEGASFYTLTYKEDQAGVPYKVFFDEIAEGASLEAGKPYLFIAEDETITGIKVGEPTTIVHPYNGFIGVLDNANTRLTVTAQDEADHKYYIIYGNEIRLCGEGSFNVPVERAYLDMSQMSATPVAQMPGRRRVALTNNAPQVETGIDALNASDAPVKVMINGQLFIIRGEKMFDAKGQLVK